MKKQCMCTYLIIATYQRKKKNTDIGFFLPGVASDK